MKQALLLPSLLLLSLLLLTACGRPDSSDASALSNNARWSSLPLDLYADPFLLSDSEASADLEDAIQFWHEKAGRTLFHFRGAWNSGPVYSGSLTSPDMIYANVIFFEGPWPFESEVAGKTVSITEAQSIQASMIILNPDTAICSGNCAGQASHTSRRKLLAHELGHMLGLNHTESTQNIMNPYITTGGSLSGLEVDPNELSALTD